MTNPHDAAEYPTLPAPTAPGHTDGRVAEEARPGASSPAVTRRWMLPAVATAGAVIAQSPAMAQPGEEALAATQPLTYFLKVSEFLQSIVQIPATPVKFQNPAIVNTTTASKYFAGIADIYVPSAPHKSVGRCSASFMCFKNDGRYYTDIANYISVNNGLIVSWFTPTTLLNLALDSAIHSMVTECIVLASTKVGFNPYYGKQFNLKVSSGKTAGVEQIRFQFTRI